MNCDMQREQRTFWAAVATLALFSFTGCEGADLAIKLDGGTCKKETPAPPPPSPHTPCCCPRPTRVLCREVSKLKENNR